MSPSKSQIPISVQALMRAIMPHAPHKYLHPLEIAMQRYQIDTPKRIVAFLSQIAVESNQLRHTHELWTSRKDFKLAGVHRSQFTASNAKEYFEHWYGELRTTGARDSACNPAIRPACATLLNTSWPTATLPASKRVTNGGTVPGGINAVGQAFELLNGS